MQTEPAIDFSKKLQATRDARDAQAAARGCCGMGFVLLVAGWLLVQCGVALWRGRMEGRIVVYPDPVCEACGLPLDGSHPVCSPKDLTITSAAEFMAEGNGEP